MINIGEFFKARLSKQPEQNFGGAPLSKLSQIAKSIDFRNYCTIDSHGLLVLHHRDLYGVATLGPCQSQFELDDNMKLILLNGTPYSQGDRISHTGEFVNLANSTLEFTCQNK